MWMFQIYIWTFKTLKKLIKRIITVILKLIICVINYVTFFFLSSIELEFCMYSCCDHIVCIFHTLCSFSWIRHMTYYVLSLVAQLCTFQLVVQLHLFVVLQKFPMSLDLQLNLLFHHMLLNMSLFCNMLSNIHKDPFVFSWWQPLYVCVALHLPRTSYMCMHVFSSILIVNDFILLLTWKRNTFSCYTCICIIEIN